MRRFVTALTLALFTLAPASATAAAPTISGTTFSEIRANSATLEAKVNPGNKANTKYRFEYGTEDCASSPCGSTPQVTLEKGEADVPVEAGIEGLQAGTTYHFRVVAKNGDGESESPDTVFTTQIPPQVFGPCPNDAFRIDQPSAKLPDCRAYEQASPAQKNGVDIGGQTAFLKASPSGDAVSFMTLSSLPGGVGGQELPLYLARRDPLGWSTQGLLPSPGFGEEVFYRGWTPDFSQVFSVADNLSAQNDGTLISRSADGSHTTVVPYGSGLTGASYVGASADGSKVLFESKGKLPGTEAIEGVPNLYLWERDSGEVKLAGVLNDGGVPEQGVFPGSGAGTYIQDAHAVALDGSLAFTDEKSGQLYLRRNPAAEQSAIVLNASDEEECTEPAKACTIHVSTTQKEHGAGPGGSDAAGTRAARFETATPDGSKLFFTSPEKLTNDANTGPEPPPPAIARSDLEGENEDFSCLPVASRGIAVDATHVYWANPAQDTIGRAELDCGDPETLIEDARSPQYVAVGGGYVYWTNAENAAGEEGEGKSFATEGFGSIGRAKLKPDGVDEVDQEFVTGAVRPRGVAVDDEYVYWANAGNSRRLLEGEPGSTRTIGRAKLGPSEADDVDQEFINLEFSFSENTPQGLAVDATHIYVGIAASEHGIFSLLFRYDIDGAASSRKIFNDSSHIGLPGAAGISVDSTHVYWSRQGLDTIGRINLDLEPASAEREFIKDAGHPQGVAVDSEHIYWSANGEVLPNPGNDLYRYDVGSGDLTDIAVDPDDENGADVQGVLGTSDDGSYVYFAANGDLDGEAGPATPGDCQWSVGNDLDSSGRCNLYLAHGDAIEFIAPLDASGGSSGGSDALNWLPRGVGGQLHKTSRVAPDGQTLIFSSKSQLTGYQNEGKTELYRYLVGEPGLHCITCNPTGEPPRGKGAFSTGTSDIGWGLGNINFPALAPSAQPAFILSHNLSVDGNKVFFESTEALVAADINGIPATPGEDGCPLSANAGNSDYPICKDVYEWEAQGTGSCTAARAHDGGCLYLLSSGTSDQPSFFLDASTDGSNAFLITRSPLVGQDGDQLYDVYDARVGGGLKSQNESPHVPCESEGCKPGPSAPPQNQSAGTASFAGPASPKPSLHRKAKKAKKAKKRAHRRKGHRRHHRRARQR
jgi:sugar lactone lactonase YvrE